MGKVFLEREAVAVETAGKNSTKSACADSEHFLSRHRATSCLCCPWFQPPGLHYLSSLARTAFKRKRQLILMAVCYAVTLSISTLAHAAAYEVGGHQIEVTLTPVQPTIMLGEPTTLSFTIHNHSDEDLEVTVGGDYENALGRPDSFSVAAVGADGEKVPQPSSGPDFGGLSWAQRIPAQGEYAFSLFLPHWATFQTPGDYQITATRTLGLSPYGPRTWLKPTWSVRAEASTQIRVVPADAQKMGELITKLGATMLDSEDTGEAAARSLSYISDERIIPYFTRVFERHSYEWKDKAIRVMGNFNNDAALETLKRAMTTRASDIGDFISSDLNDEAGGLRYEAAIALTHSPHPQAYAFLISQFQDPYKNVRYWIVLVAAAHKPAPDLAILRIMALDSDKTVSDEAKRYLRNFVVSPSKTT